MLFSLGANTGVQAAEPLQARALLEPRQQATLGSQLDGRIERLPLREGEAFAKGDLLVQFDCAVEQATRRRAQAELQRAEKTLESQRRLQSLDAATELELALAEADLAKAKADLSLTQTRVGRCRVFAPFAGRVDKLHVRAHESVTQGQPMVDIVDQGEPEIALLVPSSWLSWLRPGQQFQLTVSETGGTYSGNITRLGARVDPVSHSLTVHGRLSQKDPRLLPGMSGIARFDSTEPAKQ